MQVQVPLSPSGWLGSLTYVVKVRLGSNKMSYILLLNIQKR
ncbi:MAG: hypothetical protein ACTS4X_00460 [Candidatus Hodgkinia cicadicola]